MRFLKQFWFWLSQTWDPRAKLAKEFLDAAQKFEGALRQNTSVSAEIIEAVLGERQRILDLMRTLLPECAERLFVVPTQEKCVESCSVFQWKDHTYVLVSAALIGRPIDYPQEPGTQAWEWLARHEAAHVRHRHLPYFFYTRRSFQATCLPCALLNCCRAFVTHPNLDLCWGVSWWIVVGTWVVQTVVGVWCEWRADCIATSAITDPDVLEDVEKTLRRMFVQSSKCARAPFGWLLHFANLLLFQPHPPFAMRRWLFRRRIAALYSRLNVKLGVFTAPKPQD